MSWEELAHDSWTTPSSPPARTTTSGRILAPSSATSRPESTLGRLRRAAVEGRYAKSFEPPARARFEPQPKTAPAQASALCAAWVHCSFLAAKFSLVAVALLQWM